MISGVDLQMVAGAAAGIIVWDNLPYRSGARTILAGTNTGVTAGSAFTIDVYTGHGSCVQGGYNMPNIVAPSATTFGGALTANAWGTQAFAPAVSIPNGKYAILGFTMGAQTCPCAVRFQHADFGGLSPGIVATNPWITTLAVNQDIFTDAPYQFITMGRLTGQPCCPVFTVGPSGTGLNIQVLSPTATTPTINLLLAKVG